MTEAEAAEWMCGYCEQPSSGHTAEWVEKHCALEGVTVEEATAAARARGFMPSEEGR